MQPGLRSGKLTKWKEERGFGFIQPVDGSQEVFLHISEVKDATRSPQENDTIYMALLHESGNR
jgi:cold shock CspA family protein